MSHVLIVDDEESICWGLQRLLTETGHKVSVAASAEQAFESVARPLLNTGLSTKPVRGV